MHRMKSTSLIIAIMLVTVATSCQECCTWYVVLTQPSWHDPCSCNVTLSYLQYNLYVAANANASTCFGRKIVFQSGIHQVTRSVHGCQELLFKDMKNVIIQGQPDVTINCKDMVFYFVNVSAFKIQNMHFQNCTCSYGIPGLLYDTTGLSKVMAVIENSNFTNSHLGFIDGGNSVGPRTTIIISNAVFQDCKCPSDVIYNIIDMTRFRYGFLNLTLNSINVRNNSCIFFSILHYKKKDIERSSQLSLRLTGYTYFTGNVRSSLVIVCSEYDFCELQFSSTKVYFTNNTGDDGVAPIWIFRSTVEFENCHAVFSNNRGDKSGVIRVDFSKFIFNDNTTVMFISNIGKEAGAISLGSNSTTIFNATRSSISLHFTNNTAQNKGGAIYVERPLQNYSPSGFTVHLDMTHGGRVIGDMEVKSVFDLQCNSSLVKLTFKNNSALHGGNHIYGGWVDWFVKDGITTYNLDTMEEILITEGNSSSDITSDPVRICMCENSHPICNITNHTVEIYGYVAHLDLVAVGQRYTPVSGYVDVYESLTKNGNNHGTFNDQNISPTVATLSDKCTTVKYTIYSDNIEVLEFEPHYTGETYNILHIINKFNLNDSATMKAQLLFQYLSVKLKTKGCPLGLSLHKTNRNCVCQKRLLMLGLTCDLYSSRVHRNRQQWVGIIHEHTNSTHEDAGVIVHQQCPFDYCRTDSESLMFHLEDEDKLCAFNRSGILCGGCKINFSRVLGSSRCKICSSNFLLLAVIPLWLLSGIVLVIFLMILDFTVSTGAINGLIFYANIIHVQQSIYFTSSASNSFLNKFIAWLSFDYGVEICLYDGLDTYIIIWLQFFFLIYIWIFMAAMIISSLYSTRISRLVGNNAVQVLATLFLFSYTKLLCLIIDVISFTTVTYPNGHKSTVWLVDGNVEFLSRKHMLLFLFSLSLVLCSLLYILMLLTVQLHNKISQYRFMCWVNKLKPLLDAYTVPYIEKHRYWTGLLLAARIVLLMSFSLNRSNNPTIDHLATISVSSTLLLWLYLTGWIYKSFLNNCLELFFLSNLLFISTSMLFELSNNEHSPAIIYTSTGMTFVIFTGLIFYHALRRLTVTRVGRKIREYFQVQLTRRKLGDNTDVTQLVYLSSNLTSTVVDLSKLLQDGENCQDGKNL